MRSVIIALLSPAVELPPSGCVLNLHTRAGKYTITCTQTNVYTRRRTLLQTNTHRVYESTVSVGVIAGAAATAAGPMFPFATCLAGSGIGRHPRWVITVPAQVSTQTYLTILYIILIKLKPTLIMYKCIIYDIVNYSLLGESCSNVYLYNIYVMEICLTDVILPCNYMYITRVVC